jgi:hypothetical protein
MVPACIPLSQSMRVWIRFVSRSVGEAQAADIGTRSQPIVRLMASAPAARVK